MGLINAEKFNLISLKETYPDVLKESIKYVLKKNSKLAHALKSRAEEDVEELRGIFKEVGVPLNLWKILCIIYRK